MKLKSTFLFIGLLSLTCFAQNPPPCGLGYVLEACDADDDGFAQFNLLNANEYLFCGTIESNFETPKFYLSQFDAETDTNPIEDFESYTNVSNPQTIYATAVYKSTGVTSILNPFDIEAKMLTYSVSRLYNCDNDGDGLSTFDLTSAVSFCGANNPSDYSVTYYISQDDANNRTNQIANPNSYISSTTTIYIVIENINTGDFQHNSFNIIVSPISIGSPTDIVACDNDGDGVFAFDLTIQNAMILGNLDPNAYTLTYYVSFADADAGINAIANPSSHSVSNTETIYVRVEDNSLGCYTVYSFLVSIEPAPFVIEPTNLEVCDDASGDGIETFDLTSKIAEIIGDQTDVSISYHSTQIDATNGTNPLIPSSYTNSTNPETIYVRVQDNLGGCYAITTLNLIVQDCANLGVIELNAFYDANTNTTFENGEDLFVNGFFTYVVNNDGIQHIVSSSTGSFSILSNNESNTYDISYSLFDEYLDCYAITIPIYEDVSVINGNMVIYNFPITKENPCEDVAVYLVSYNPPKPGFDYYIRLVIQNKSIEPVTSGSVEFIQDASVTLNGVSNVDSGNTITNTATGFTLYFVNLQPNQFESVLINMNVPVSVNLGDLLTNTATYSVNDLNLDNNTSTLTETVVGSFDPNDIAESHGPYIFFDEFTPDDYLYYTIRFQNVGTADAINISIDNTLDSKLEKSTVVMLNASHDYVFTRTDNQLNWKFNTINLPSESMDEPNSHGYVHYKIKPLAGYAVGDILPNGASIYFDFNPAVITNTFETEFVETLSTEDFKTSEFTIYPNPATNTVNLMFGKAVNDNIDISIYDIQGKLILNSNTELQNNATNFNVTSLKSGMYFLKVNNSSFEAVRKLIIK